MASPATKSLPGGHPETLPWEDIRSYELQPCLLYDAVTTSKPDRPFPHQQLIPIEGFILAYLVTCAAKHMNPQRHLRQSSLRPLIPQPEQKKMRKLRGHPSEHQKCINESATFLMPSARRRIHTFALCTLKRDWHVSEYRQQVSHR